MENTEQRGTGIENGSELVKWNGPFRSHRSNREKWSTSKGGPMFSKLFRLDRTDPFRFRPKFPEILVEWIAPSIFPGHIASYFVWSIFNPEHLSNFFQRAKQNGLIDSGFLRKTVVSSAYCVIFISRAQKWTHN